jgi:iron(III) transport system ATP-binding protein
MNKGRIEQIDAPYALYGNPRTRFVAGFIGRTNFLRGQANGKAVDFGGFSVPADQLPRERNAAGEVMVSIRPQSINLLDARPAAAHGRCLVEGSIERRAYLGEYWDYYVSIPGTAEPLRVTTRPHEVFEVRQPVFIEIDARQMALVA